MTQEKAAVTPLASEWDRKVGSVLSSVRRKSLIYLGLGLSVYGLGSVSIMYAMRENPGLATAAVMFFFQILVIIFSTSVIFPCIAGGFHVGLLANRESMPVFEKLGDAAEKISGQVDSKTVEEFKEMVAEMRDFFAPKGLPPDPKRGLERLRAAGKKPNGQEVTIS